MKTSEPSGLASANSESVSPRPEEIRLRQPPEAGTKSSVPLACAGRRACCALPLIDVHGVVVIARQERFEAFEEEAVAVGRERARGEGLGLAGGHHGGDVAGRRAFLEFAALGPRAARVAGDAAHLLRWRCHRGRPRSPARPCWRRGCHSRSGSPGRQRQGGSRRRRGGRRWRSGLASPTAESKRPRPRRSSSAQRRHQPVLLRLPLSPVRRGRGWVCPPRPPLRSARSETK